MKLLMSTQFKKDLKRYQNKPRKIAALKVVLKSLKYSKIHIMPLSSRKPHGSAGFLFPLIAVGSLLYVRPPFTNWKWII